MKIDYQKFNDCSPTTQQEVISFSKMLLSSIELFDLENKGKIRLHDFEQGNFDLPKMAGLWKILNRVIDNRVIEISHEPISGWGPRENRRLTVDLDIKYKPDTASVLKEFLKKVDKNVVGRDASKIALEINKEEKSVRNMVNNKTYAFRKSGGKNKRFDYLVAIVNNSKKVAGRKLSPDITAQALSGEIDKINENIKSSLDLVEKIIINDNNSGYGKNENAYIFNFI